MVLDYKGKNNIGNWTCINYLQYLQSKKISNDQELIQSDPISEVWSLYTEHAASGLPNPTHLEGEVRFD